MSQDRERLKGWGARRQVGRATHLRDRKKFQGRLREKLRELFRQEVGAELRAGAALNNVELYRAHFFQLAVRPCRPSVAHSQRGGFAADYLTRK